jgi:hypothetical protein
VNDQITRIVAALLSGQSYSTVSKEVIRATVDQAEAVVAEINRRFKGGENAG